MSYSFTSFSNTGTVLLPYGRVSVPYIFISFSNQINGFLSQSFVSVPYIFTSFSNSLLISSIFILFQYHTFLHHSQTPPCTLIFFILFQYHTFLHHSQTHALHTGIRFRFSTIHFYIILKRQMCSFFVFLSFQYHTFLHHSQTMHFFLFLLMCFSTIHFYIILKQTLTGSWIMFVSVPYIFTSFSNLKFKNEPPSFAQNKVLKHI